MVEATSAENVVVDEQAPVSSEPTNPTPESTPSAAAVSDPVTTGAPPERTDRGDGRDITGKFVPKPGDPVAPVDPADPQVGDVPPAAAEQANTTPPPDALAQEATPFSFKSLGEEYAFEGSRVTDSEIIFPKTAQQDLHKYLGWGARWEVEGQALKRDKLAVQQQLADAQATSKEIDALFQIAAIPDENQFAEAGLAYLLELRNALPTLSERRELAREREAIRIERALQAPDPEVRRAQIDSQVLDHARSELDDYTRTPQFEGLTDADKQRLMQAVERNPAAYAHRAPADPRQFSEEERRLGVSPGEIYFGAQLHKDALWLAQIRQDAIKERKAAEQQVKEAAKIAAANQKRLDQDAAPPPLGTAKAKPATPAAAPVKRSKEEDRDAYLKEMGLLI